MMASNGMDEILSQLKAEDDRGLRERLVAQIIASSGDWLEQEGLDKVLETLDEAIVAAEELDQPAQAAHALEQKAMLLNRAERSDEALTAIESAIESAEAADEPKLAQELVVRRTIVLTSLGRLPEAIDVIGQILESLDPSESRETYLRLLGLLGNYHLRAAQYEQAETVFRQALSMLEDDRVSGDFLHSQLGLSQALVGQERFAEAQKLLLDQLELVPDDQVATRWEFLRPAIEISHQIEEWETLLNLTKQAMELAARQGDFHEANIHRENLISTLLRLERLEEAKGHLENALDYARRKGPKERKLVHLMNLGRVTFDLGELDESLEYYRKAQAEAESQGNMRAVSTIMGRQGALMAEKGELEAALELGQSAIARAEEANDPLIIAEQSVLLALTYRDLDQMDEAIQASQRAAGLYHQEGEENFAASAKALEQELRSAQSS